MKLPLMLLALLISCSSLCDSHPLSAHPQLHGRLAKNRHHFKPRFFSRRLHQHSGAVVHASVAEEDAEEGDEEGDEEGEYEDDEEEEEEGEEGDAPPENVPAAGATSDRSAFTAGAPAYAGSHATHGTSTATNVAPGAPKSVFNPSVPAMRPRAGVSEEEEEGDLKETNNTDLDRVHEPASEPTVKMSAADVAKAKVPTELPTIGTGGGEFRGVAGGVVDGTNITHLSYMVFKIIKKYEISSVLDMPCRNTLHWFPALLHRLDFEIVGFKYYCVDSEAPSQDDIRHLFSDAGSPVFMHVKPEESNQLPKADLYLSWNGPQEWGVRRTWAYFHGLREVRPDYLLVTNNPGATNTNADDKTLNVRKQPFHVSFLHLKASSQHPKMNSGLNCSLSRDHLF